MAFSDEDRQRVDGHAAGSGRRRLGRRPARPRDDGLRPRGLRRVASDLSGRSDQRMVALIARLASDHAILLVEHDMDAVFSVASVLTVMVDGRVLASGAPEAIRRNKAVQEAYLGTAEGAA